MPTKQITFVVPGEHATPRGAGASGESRRKDVPGSVKESVRVRSMRAQGDWVKLVATVGEDAVAVHLRGGPVLVLHPESARDLMLAQSSLENAGRRAGATRGTRSRAPDAAEVDEVWVPAELSWEGLEPAQTTRSVLGAVSKVVVSAVEVLTGLFGGSNPAEVAADALAGILDGRVEAGVYALEAGKLESLKGSGKLSKIPAADGAPALIFIHGTFVDTASTFDKLWSEHPARVRELFANYRNRVYGLDHPTLGRSPIDNARTLVEAADPGAVLHLLTHSRGGLVAEVLARICSGRPLTDAELAAFSEPAHADQRHALIDVAKLAREKNLSVARIVRVACPARGTLLASKRLDAYLSAFKWALELVGIPVAPAILEFLGKVAAVRLEPEKLPGLAAMVPDSPLIAWLHASDRSIPGELRVVAGDLQGDSVGSWVKTLLADAFYWTDNDLIVQTSSMYGGSPRESRASFLLDRGSRVSHFEYFRNQPTVDAIVDGLIRDEPPGYRQIGPLSWSGKDPGGVRARRERATSADSSKPAVFVLPGILGSHLKQFDDRIWLSHRIVGGLTRLAYDPPVDGVQSDGPIGPIYDGLIDFLADTHEVIPFGFDWRIPIENEARRLADAVTRALDARKASGAPVRLLAHSMGGLLARTMQLECPDVWARLFAIEGARLLMLGTPNAGSFAPMQVLSGDDTFGDLLVTVGAPFKQEEARKLMAQMPGFLQLQAGLLDTALGLANESSWVKLADDDRDFIRMRSFWHRAAFDLGFYRWGIPSQAVLLQAVGLRQRLDAQREQELPKYASKLLLVVGQGKFTPAGYEFSANGLTYRNAVDGGDSRVTLEAALLPGVKTWTVASDHSKLPAARAAFAGYLELLVHGTTRAIAPLGGSSRSASGSISTPAPVYVSSRPSRKFGTALPPSDFSQILDPRSLAELVDDAGQLRPLEVTVQNGNLKFVRLPLMVGHYRSVALTGAERVVDALIGGTMSAALKSGSYPDPPGTHRVFSNINVNRENPLSAPRPEGVVVVGLGEEGKFKSAELAMTVRHGVIAWAQRLHETAPERTEFELATTLIGSGGIDISAGASARAIAQGVRDANQRLTEIGWPRVQRLVLVELYQERAAEAWRGLDVQDVADRSMLLLNRRIELGTGWLLKPLESDYRGADYDLITATTRPENENDSTIYYRLDTRRARTEIRAQATQQGLVRQLVANAASDSNQDLQIGRTLFQLLVPIEVEPFLGGTSCTVLELDAVTAAIPWELLSAPDDGSPDIPPWAIRSQLLRKFQTTSYREQVTDSGRDDYVLVVGSPLTEPIYPPLPAAEREAQTVASVFNAVDPTRLKTVPSRSDARTVINALFDKHYRIVHVAGHGELGAEGGVVLSGQAFLGAREIQSMRKVPELVFVNCCHLAAREWADERSMRVVDRPQFASSVADALIKIGVRCVVAAGWAVGDQEASQFAETFYRALLDGKPFRTAVSDARAAIVRAGDNTWAAYQCYGDPDWRYRPSAGATAAPNPANRRTDIATPFSLKLWLDTLVSQVLYEAANLDQILAKVRELENTFAPSWGSHGDVAEAFARAYAEAGATADAIRWYEHAATDNEGRSSLRASEQLANLYARHAAANVGRAISEAGDTIPSAEIDRARNDIERALELLTTLNQLQPTVEREGLRGSAYKRLASLERLAGNPAAELAATLSMRDHYARAMALAGKETSKFYYPAINHFVASLVLDPANPARPGFDEPAFATLRKVVEERARVEPDFWSVAAGTELRVYAAVARGDLALLLPSILHDFEDLHARVPAPHKWESVHDTASFALTSRAVRQRGDAGIDELLALLQRFASDGR